MDGMVEPGYILNRNIAVYDEDLKKLDDVDIAALRGQPQAGINVFPANTRITIDISLTTFDNADPVEVNY